MNMSNAPGKRVRFTEAKETPTAKISKPNSDYKKFQLNNDQVKMPGSHPGARFKENHSLDSDSEDESEKKKEKLDYEKMTEEDVEGAEDEVYESDGEKITPFNLREEMEEGDFDTDGNYHFKKDREIRDNWLDNIDWVTVKKQKNKQNESESVEMQEEEAPYSELEVFTNIVELMQTSETVTKAIRRLGNKNKTSGKNNRKRPWEKKKVYDLDATAEGEDKSEGTSSSNDDKANLLKLTELVDRVAGTGNYDIYTDTYEKLQFKIKLLKAKEESEKVVLPEDDDDALDMLGSNIDKEDSEDKTNGKASKDTNNKEEDKGDDDGVKWIYKWKMDDTETHGPFSSEQMQEWKDGGFFVENAFVQRTDRPGEQFYSVKRMDFDLYT